MKNYRTYIIASIPVILACFVGIWLYSSMGRPDMEKVNAEEKIYLEYSTKLKEVAELIKIGSTRFEVESLVGTAPDHLSIDKSMGTSAWTWNAGVHTGSLRKSLGLARSKGHFSVGVSFDETGVVKKVWSGIN